MAPKMKKLVRAYLNWRKKNPGQGRKGVQQAIKMMGLSPQDGNQLIDTLNNMVSKGELPKHLAIESYLPDEGTDDARKFAKKMTPGEAEESFMPTTAQKRMNRALKKHGVGKHDDFYKSKLSPEKRKEYEPKKFERKPVSPKISTPPEKRFNWLRREMTEGSETWEAGYKRRVVKTTKPEHKEKGYKWRIKGKDRPEISIKLYKEKPSQAEFNKQMKRVAGHEFGG